MAKNIANVFFRIWGIDKYLTGLTNGVIFFIYSLWQNHVEILAPKFKIGYYASPVGRNCLQWVYLVAYTVCDYFWRVLSILACVVR